MRGPLVLDRAVFRDKVLGCWLGKNAGGTLGEPLEERFGRIEMFEVSWYPELPPGGIPNDDLELQLVWFQVLQEKGPGLTSDDLAQAWLDCIAYNWDEYGLSKANLRRGLRPPVSGWHDNWFKDCMGSPIRSEIWACVSPGAPGIAARYALQDSVCDHAGGESVYGEIFNAVVESSAFVESDRLRLIEIGLSAIPESSLTSRAIRRVTELHRVGAGWKEARERIRTEFYHPVSQYSPINMGFQTIGWLYGEDFGDSLCKAVNCGWDTDCTAATLGAILGIVNGAKALPRNWLEPLGEEISTNVKNGGIRNLEAPTNIQELTDQVCETAERVLEYWGAGVRIGDGIEGPLRSGIPAMGALSPGRTEPYEPNVLKHDLGSVKLELAYGRSAAITAVEPVPLRFRLRNPHPEVVRLTVSVSLPEEWTAEPGSPAELTLEPFAAYELRYSVSAPAGAIRDTQSGFITFRIEERPVPPAVPVVLLGGSRWLVSEVLEGNRLEDDGEPVGTLGRTSRPEGFREVWRTGNDLEPETLFEGDAGTVHLVHHVYAAEDHEVVVGVPNSGRMAVYLEGKKLHETVKILPIRPNMGNTNARGDGSNYVRTVLRAGWNRFVVTLERGAEPLEAHFVFGAIDGRYPQNCGAAVLGLKRSGFSWE